MKKSHLYSLLSLVIIIVLVFYSILMSYKYHTLSDEMDNVKDSLIIQEQNIDTLSNKLDQVTTNCLRMMVGLIVFTAVDNISVISEDDNKLDLMMYDAATINRYDSIQLKVLSVAAQQYDVIPKIQ